MTTLVMLSPEQRAGAALIDQVAAEAEFMAELAARYLERLGLFGTRKSWKKNSLRLPPEFLLELSAVLRLSMWERAGIRDRLDPSLPSARQAMANLLGRFGFGEEESEVNVDSSDLLTQVSKTFLTRLAASGRLELDVDVVLDAPDSELPLKAIANFLWQNRHLGISKD